MSKFYQTERVKYDCSCGKKLPLAALFFCVHCQKMKCDECLSSEVDCYYCPRCLETPTLSETRMKNFKCVNCFMCPLCGKFLSGKKSSGKHFLKCNFCQWTTRESAEEDRESTARWPVHESTLSDELKRVMEKCGRLAEQENMNKVYKSRRSGKFGYHLSDKFGLQTTYENRKLSQRVDTPEVPVHAPTDPVPFDESLLDGKLRSCLDEVIPQPLAGDRAPAPIRVSYLAREQYRCETCERTVMKRHYGIKGQTFKINLMAIIYTPEVKLARAVDLSSGGTLPVLLSITNNSAADILVQIQAVESENNMKIVTKNPIELTVSSADNASTASNVPDGPDVVNKNGNKAVIRLEISTEDSKSDYITLSIKYKFASDLFSTLLAAEKSAQTNVPEWYTNQVEVRLGNQ